jgi:hypothetical protein
MESATEAWHECTNKRMIPISLCSGETPADLGFHAVATATVFVAAIGRGLDVV